MTAAAVLLAGAAAVLVLPLPQITPRRMWKATAVLANWYVMAAIVGSAAGIVAGPVAAVLAGAVVGAGHWLRRRSRRERTADAERVAAVEMLGVLAAELRSGRPPRAALGVAAAVPGCTVLAATARALELGAEPPAAWRAVPAHGALGEVSRRIAAAWAVAERGGVPLAEVLARVEAEASSTLELRRRLRSELAGGTTTAGLLAGLPVLGVALGAAIGAQPLHILLHTAVGAGCALVGLAFDLAGIAWALRLGRAAVERAG